ncbi:hypothetical protein ABFX02_05G027500 [Erythranthe guttata]
MNAINSCRILGFDYSLCSTANAHVKIKSPISSLPCSQFFRPNFGPNCKPFSLPSRLRISYRSNEAPKQCLRVSRISCLLEDSIEQHPETEQPSSSNNEVAIDLKLPRRSLLVTFTCDSCGARSQRLINRLAYERGLVYVQCSGCSQYHKLVDNLGLVVEYNLHEEVDSDATTNEV